MNNAAVPRKCWKASSLATPTLLLSRNLDKGDSTDDESVWLKANPITSRSCADRKHSRPGGAGPRDPFNEARLPQILFQYLAVHVTDVVG